MKKNNFQFLEVGRVDPKKLAANVRVQEFGEIYGQFDAPQAAEQCLQLEYSYSTRRQLLRNEIIVEP